MQHANCTARVRVRIACNSGGSNSKLTAAANSRLPSQLGNIAVAEAHPNELPIVNPTLGIAANFLYHLVHLLLWHRLAHGHHQVSELSGMHKAIVVPVKGLKGHVKVVLITNILVLSRPEWKELCVELQGAVTVL